jgi:transcriptional regulator with XRE-family HTH domain
MVLLEWGCELETEEEPFGAWLKRKRTEARMTQTELGQKVGGKTKQSISVWERGYVSDPEEDKPIIPDAEDLKAIVAAFRGKGLPVTEHEIYKAAGIPTAEPPPVAPPPVSEFAVEVLNQIAGPIGEWLKTRGDGSPQREGEREVTALARALMAFFGNRNVSPYTEPPRGGYVEGGTGDYYQAELPAPEDNDPLWLCVVSGESMWTGYQPGDELIVRETPYPVVGKEIVFLYQGLPVFKKLVERKTGKGRKPKLQFKPLNDRFKMPDLLPEDDITVLGVVKKLLMEPEEATRLREENERLRRLYEGQG